MQLSVIIVNYNVKYFLEQCLCSLKRALSDIDSEVLVVDNCSNDGSIEYLTRKFSWVKFIAAETNGGFAKANNSALKQCNGEYVLYLNPDTIMPENILQYCLGFFKTHKDAGAVGVRMIDGAGNFLPESKRAFPSPVVSFYKLSGLSALFPNSAIFNKYALGSLSEEEVHEVDILCGAFMMAERKLLNNLNGFDEAFFMYGEDIDLCYRIKQTGKKLFYLGTATIIHFKGESSLKDNSKYVKIFYQAMFVFVKKHFSGGNAFLMKLFMQTGIFARAFFSFTVTAFRKARRKLATVNDNSSKNFVLVGDDESRKQAGNILVNNGIKISSELPFLNADKKDVSIVFCTGQLSYDDAISFVSRHKNSNHYYWHGNNSTSIVGSSDKNFTGVVYSL